MEISRLNERITVEKNTVVTDAIGNHKNTWAPYFSCYAYASTYQAEEKESAVSSEERSVTFSVRLTSRREICTKPSLPGAISTNAPKSMRRVTLPL